MIRRIGLLLMAALMTAMMMAATAAPAFAVKPTEAIDLNAGQTALAQPLFNPAKLDTATRTSGGSAVIHSLNPAQERKLVEGGFVRGR